MKRSTLRLFLFSLVTLLGLATSVSACNLSNISLCGVYKNPLLNPAFPNDSMICVTVCNGYGRTGATKGANSDTRSISFGWYTHRVQPLTPTNFIIRAFTPAAITSGRGFSNCTMPGSNIGAQGSPYNDQGTVIFIDPGYFGTTPCVDQPFGCVQSTVQCGGASQQCITYRFQVNKIPDSLRVFGIEGGGNPLAGCYPDADMKINFVPTAVEWGPTEAIADDHSVKVKWTTMQETNSDLFIVERSNSQNGFTELGTVPAAGNSEIARQYEFVDLAPMPSANVYRIVQVDKEGNVANSPFFQAIFNSPIGLNWGAIGPNPAKDYVNLTYYNDRVEAMTLTVHDLQGNTVVRQEIQSINGANALRLALDQVDAGSYFVSIQGTNGKLTRKVVKL